MGPTLVTTPLARQLPRLDELDELGRRPDICGNFRREVNCVIRLTPV